MRVAVVGHVEWIEFARVERVPAPGEIVHALEAWEEPAGGGAVAAVQLARLAGECLFLTALGDDALGHRAKRELEALGVRVEAAWRAEPQRRAFVYLDAERRAHDHGDRRAARAARGRSAALGRAATASTPSTSRPATRVPCGRREQPARWWRPCARSTRWRRPASSSTRWFRAPTTRASATRRATSTRRRCSSCARPAPAAARSWRPDGTHSRWAAAPLPGPPVDAYGAGDCFAAGLTYGLAEGHLSLTRRWRSGRAAARRA